MTQAVGLGRRVAIGRARTNRCHRDQIDASQGPRTRQPADEDELGLVAKAATETRVAAVPGNGPDANVAGSLQGPDGLAQAVVVGHGHQDPIGLELGAGDRKDPADLGPGQAMLEPVAEVTAGGRSVDRDIRRVRDDQIDRAIRQSGEQLVRGGLVYANPLGPVSSGESARTVHGCNPPLSHLAPEVARCPSEQVIAA